MALPIVYEMDYLLHLWLGDTVPAYTVVFSQIILVIAIVETYNWPVSMIIYASGKIGWYNIITSFIGLLVLPLCYIVLSYNANPVWVYIISLFISIAVQTASLFCMRTIVGIKILEYCRKVLLPSLLVFGITFFIPAFFIRNIEQGFFRLFVVFIVSVSAVVIAIYHFGLNSREKGLIVSFIRNFSNKYRKNGK